MFPPMLCRVLLAAASYWVASVAEAAGGLAVVNVYTPPTMVGIGVQVTQTILEAAREEKVPVLLPDEIRAAIGERQYEELRACEGNPGCVQAKLVGLKVDRAVLGSLTRDERSYLVRLWLVDVAKGEVVSTVDRSVLIAARRLTLDLREAVPRLLRGEKEATGTLKITSRVKNVRVFVDQVEHGVLPLSVELKPGKHELRFEKPAYLPVERLMTVEAGAVTEEEVRLILRPNEEDPDEKQPVFVTEVQEPPPEEQSFRLPLSAMVLAGVAAGAGVVGASLGFASKAAETKLKEGFDPGADTYAGTRREALEGARLANLANVAFVVAGTSLLGGVVITLLENRRPAKVSVAPGLVPSGGAVFVEGSY